MNKKMMMGLKSRLNFSGFKTRMDDDAVAVKVKSDADWEKLKAFHKKDRQYGKIALKRLK